jgi:GDP-L-fucose synthase
MAPDSFYAGKNVLVAGGTGVIGIPVTRRLAVAGARITVVAMDPEPYAARVLPPGVAYLRRDLTSLANCLEVTAGQEVVFNLVGIKGSTGIGETRVASYLVPMLWFQTNLMEAAFRSGAKRFLFASSICGYPYSERPKAEDTLWDGLPRQNDRIPGLAKRIGEIQGEAYLKEYGWDAVRIVRPSNVYGPYDDFDPATAQVIPSLIRRCLDGESPLVVWGDGSALRDFVYSRDVADWILRVTAEGPVCDPLNLGHGRGISIRELAETIVSVVNPGLELVFDPARPSGDPVRILSMDKTFAALGVLPRTPLATGIREVVDWYLEDRDVMALKVEALHGPS